MMGVTNEWYIFEGDLYKKTCNKIKILAKNNWTAGAVDSEFFKMREVIPNSEVRISDISWTSDQWVYDTIWPYMQQANSSAGWNYHIKAAESMQITRYRNGGFYNFHTDGKGDHLSVYNDPQNDFLNGHVRKLSMTTLLSDNYEGGEFQFAGYSQEKCTISTPEFTKIGSIIVFPSAMEHRVAPVTKGIRYSVVCWFLGPPFK